MKLFPHTLWSIIFLFLFVIPSNANRAPRNWYFDSQKGNDRNEGSRQHPFATLGKVQQLQLQPGDSILLARGVQFEGSLKLLSVTGSASSPIVVANYGAKKRAKPLIDAKGYRQGVLIENCSFVEVREIAITGNAGGTSLDPSEKPNMRCGLLYRTTAKGDYQHIVVSGVECRDLFFEEAGFVRDAKEVKSANGTQRYGWGIRIFNDTEEANLSDIQILGCSVSNVSHTGIKFTAHRHGISNVRVENSNVSSVGGPGLQFSCVDGAVVRNNIVNGSGSNDDSRKWGRGSGMWTWSSSDFLIEHNQFLNAKGPGDSAGAHIDYNCNDIVLQYNLSANNAGGFCEILGNNYNCAYRYNVSVNDGYREKGKEGAFQEGKIFWLSGYIGKDKPKGPFNSYFYNNTIYLKADILAKMAIAKSADGILIANNIFYIEGDSKEVEGDQLVSDTKAQETMKHLIFTNNLYLKANNWPSTIVAQDKNPLIGDPGFARKGGLQIKDYRLIKPSNLTKVGIEIVPIPGDSIGLKIGLKVEKDILGNRVTSPHLGAIVPN